MTTNQSGESMDNNNFKPPKNKTVDGFKSWLIIMVCTLLAGLTMDSYNRFGIVKGPIELINILMDMALQHWWLSFTTLGCYFLQIAQMFILEKLLSTGLITEKMGMTFHALNVFFLPTSFTVLARITDANPVVCRLFSTWILFAMVKVWSYAYVNSTLRKSFRQEIVTSKKNEDEICLMGYPKNVTIRNIITYMIFTPPIQYQVHYPQRTEPDWKTFWKLCLQQFLVCYVTCLLSFQFLFPEMFVLRAQGGGPINKIVFILKTAVPVNLVWLIFGYINTYRTYLPAYAALTGFKNVAFSKDWWNAEDINMFWRKWNSPVHDCLKYNVVVPLIQNGCSKKTASLVAFAIAGILHEFMNSLPMGLYNGIAFLITFTEMPAGIISEYLGEKLGPRCGNILLWLYLIITHCTAVVYYSLHLPHFATEFPFKRYY